MRFRIDMIHHNPGEPPFDTTFSDPGHLAAYGFNGHGRIEDIHLSKIRGKDLGPYPIILCGVPGYTCANITLEDIDIQCSRPGSDADRIAPTDWRDHQYPMAPMFGSALPAYGLCTRAVKNLKTKNLTLRAADGEPRRDIAHF